MSPIVKCEEAIMDRTVQETPTDGFETVLFDEETPAGDASGAVSPSVAYVSEDDNYMNNTLEVLRKGRWQEISQIVSDSPKVCAVRFSTAESSENFLFHEACKAGAPVCILELMATVNKEAVARRGHGGYLPLHFACANGAAADVIAFLVGDFPGSIHMVENTDRMLPLHLASKFGVAEDAMMIILSSFPEATMVKDGFGRTPMDFAKAQSNAPLRNATISYLERGGWLCSASASARHWAELAHKKKLEDLEQEMEVAFAQLETHHQEATTKLEKKVILLESEITSKNNEIDSIVQIMKTQTAQLNDDVDREHQTVVSLRDDLKAKEDELKDTLQKMRNLETTFGTRVSNLQESYEASSEQAHDKVACENKELARLVDSLRLENSDLGEQIAKQKSQIERLQSKVTAQDAEFDQSLETMTDQITMLQDVLLETKNALEESNKKLVRATIKNLNLMTLLQRREEDRETSTGEVDALRDQVQHLTSLMTSIRHLTSAGPLILGRQTVYPIQSGPRVHPNLKDFCKESDMHSTMENNPGTKKTVHFPTGDYVDEVPVKESRVDNGADATDAGIRE